MNWVFVLAFVLGCIGFPPLSIVVIPLGILWWIWNEAYKEQEAYNKRVREYYERNRVK